jgi:hypothetical protein
MTHEELQDLLEGYVDETLDRRTRREVDDHLGGCEECRAILEGVEPLLIPAAAAGEWADPDLRRVVRRSMLRVAMTTLMLGLAVWLGALSLGYFVIQPLIVGRGGRAAASTVATAELGVLLNPGAVLVEYSYVGHATSRTNEADFGLPLGSGMSPYGSLASRIGVTAFGDAEGGRFLPFLDDGSEQRGLEALQAVGDGTVATAHLRFDPGLSVDEAQDLIDQAKAVSVTWVGFDVGDAAPDLAPAELLGYQACDSGAIHAEGQSGGGSGAPIGGPASVAGAADATVRAVSNLAAFPELLEGIGADLDEAEAALSSLADPIVDSIVITGPTEGVLEFIEVSAPSSVAVLEIDFYDWTQPPCEG